MNIFKQKLARCNAKNEHYKMYKVGRKWLFASASVLAMSQFLLVGTAKADTTDATATDTPATTQVTTANTAATNSAATLKTAPTAKTAPTTDTVKANAGTKENNQAQTDTKNAATKQNNAQQTSAATTGDKVTTADSTQKSAPKTAVTATDSKAATTTTATQETSKTTDTTQKASITNNQKDGQTASTPDQAQQVNLPVGTKISVKTDGTTVYALPVNADLKAAQAAIAASGIKGPVEITVAADQISVNVNTSTYYYGDTVAENAAQKGTDKPFYSGNVGDTVDTSKLATTDADLKAAFADPTDPNGVYTVQVGNDPQLYNSLTAAITANPKLAAGDIKVVYYSGDHLGYHDDQGQVQYMDKNMSTVTQGWITNTPSSLVETVNNAPAGKINMTAFNTAISRISSTSRGVVNNRKTMMATAQAYVNDLASFKDGQLNANLVKAQDVGVALSNGPLYNGNGTSTGNNFKQEMTLYETQLQAVKTFLDSFTADSQKGTATGTATLGTAELQAVFTPITQTLADLGTGMNETDPYLSEPYVGPQIEGLSANPTLYDAVTAIGAGNLGASLTAGQAAEIAALITSLNNAANDRDTTAAAVQAIGGIDKELPTPVDSTSTNNQAAVAAALNKVNGNLTDAQENSSFQTNIDESSNNETVLTNMTDLAKTINAATYPYSLEPTVAPLKAALTAQIAKKLFEISKSGVGKLRQTLKLPSLYWCAAVVHSF
ncbi:KxYKxGKxW signal peptide domain-containing protein, partial [Secundilactobacillus hailunensis]|uniref:KxYKxGKxW signal peptide domain-containing protein n=1 Tax=Secundilactobacillus hailunensis TaxID=2559923 RepID=UPI00148504BD